VKKNKILITIPVYNESDNISQIIELIKIQYPEYDILVVNDCSTDNTLEILRSIEGITIINLPINLGIGGAVQIGFIYALKNNYNFMVRMDGDGQHNSKNISDFIDTILEADVDILIGSRFIKRKGFQSSFLRIFGKTIIQVFLKLIINKTITDSTSGFRAYSYNAIKIFSKIYPVDYPEPEELIIAKRKSLKILEISVEMKERNYGVSSIKGFSTIYYMIKVLLALIIEVLRSEDG